jgi:hypothetical protein
VRRRTMLKPRAPRQYAAARTVPRPTHLARPPWTMEILTRVILNPSISQRERPPDPLSAGANPGNRASH